MRLMVLHGSTMGQGLAPELEEQEGAWMEVRAAVSHRPDGTAPDPARPRRQRRKGMILKRASRRINVQHPKSIRMSLSRFLSFETLPPMPREDRVDLSAGTILLIKQRNRPASYEVILAQGSPPYRLFPRPFPRYRTRCALGSLHRPSSFCPCSIYASKHVQIVLHLACLSYHADLCIFQRQRGRLRQWQCQLQFASRFPYRPFVRGHT